MEELSKEKKLLNLLNDMEEIEDKLSEWLDETNIFQILKLSRTEIRHSSFLAYLLSPNESHKWQDKFFKSLLKTVIEENDRQNDSFDYFDLVLNDYNDLMIYREHKNIDIFLVSENNKVVMAIENKIGASESKHQLNKYQNYVDSHYGDYTKLFVFLTPERDEATSNNWYLLSYYEIIEILERLIKIYGLDSKINFLVDDYLNSLRRDVIVDERLQKICNRIYSQHQEALDLIFENKPDNLSVMSELYSEAINNLEKEGLIISNPNHSGKSIIRFETKEMNKVFPRLSSDYRGGWGNHKAYSFEILNKDAKSSGKIKLAFTGKIEPQKRVVLEKTLSHFDNRIKKSNWEWWTVGNWKLKKVDQNFVDNIISTLGEEEREVIVKEITDSLRKQIVEINDYCSDLLSKYNELSKV
nr:PD-(D/E)XK nuclease family protein [uncultured Trichococcus sp.]